MEGKLIDLTKGRNIVKDNRLIEASYRLSALEQKFILLMISEINLSDPNFRYYEIRVKELLDILGIPRGGSGYRYVEKLVHGLNKKYLTLHESDGPLLVYWVASVKFYKAKGTVSFEFSSRLRPYLLQLKRAFTSYDRKYVLQLKSAYSIRIYEILKKYARLGSVRLSVEKLRTSLGLNPGEYTLYGHFKSRVLEPARKELAEKCDIGFTYEEIKTGRKVTALEFEIEIETQHPPLVREMLKIPGLAEADALEIWEQQFNFVEESKRSALLKKDLPFYDYITEKIAYCNGQIRAGKVENPPAFFIAAVKHHYTTSELEKREKKREKQRLQEDLKTLKARKDHIEQEKSWRLEDIAGQVVKAQPDGLEIALTALKQKMGVGIDHFYDQTISVYENYEQKAPFRAILNGELREAYPKAFKPLQKYDQELAEIGQRIQELSQKLKQMAEPQPAPETN